MKQLIFGTILLIFTVLAHSQDTIFVRNGAPIPAIIVEKNSTEIKYKRPGQQQSAAIYSVFTSDILKIHYSDGLVADYSAAGQTVAKAERPVDLAGTIKAFKFNIGVGYDYQLSNSNEPLLTFWRYYLNNPSAEIMYNPGSPGIFTDWGAQTGRHIFGGKLDVIITSKDAIYASNEDLSYELMFNNVFNNLAFFYGHTINHKQNIAVMIETGLDVGFGGGYIKLMNTTYENNFLANMGYHLATGVNWIVSPRVMASCRLGYRSSKMEESHKDKDSSTGYSSFYVEPGVNNDHLSMSWKGVYANVALSYSFYTRLKTN